MSTQTICAGGAKIQHMTGDPAAAAAAQPGFSWFKQIRVHLESVWLSLQHVRGLTCLFSASAPMCPCRHDTILLCVLCDTTRTSSMRRSICVRQDRMVSTQRSRGQTGTLQHCKLGMERFLKTVRIQ